MFENSNKAIVINSLIMYVKLGVTTLMALLTTRFALQALGIVDFGLYSVCGSIISFIGIFNGMMGGTCNRFLAVAVGKGNDVKTNQVFNVNRTIFFIGALIILALSLLIGNWYIPTNVNYEGPISNAFIVFYISVLGSVFSSIGCPYNGLLIAKERFFVFSFFEVIAAVIKCLVAYLLISYFENKLLIYSLTMAFNTALPTFGYWAYCKKEFPLLVKWTVVKDKNLYKEILSFSGWVGFGAFAVIARNQGASLLVNSFFNTVMNTAMGIAHSLNAFVQIFAHNISQPMVPQITKSYVSGNTQRTDELLVMATKYTFMVMLICGTPFFVACDWILQLWLGQVPPYTASFTLLMIIDTIVTSFNMGVSSLIFASGKIKWYQIITSVLRSLSVLVAYFILKAGYPPQSLYICYICFNIIMILAIQIILVKTVNYDNMNLVKKSYIPSLCVFVLFSPIFLIEIPFHPVFRIVISLIYIVIVEFLVGFSKKEKKFIFNKIVRR